MDEIKEDNSMRSKILEDPSYWEDKAEEKRALAEEVWDQPIFRDTLIMTADLYEKLAIEAYTRRRLKARFLGSPKGMNLVVGPGVTQLHSRKKIG